MPLIQSPPTRTSGRTLLSTIALHVNFFPTIPLHVNFCKWNQGIAPPFQLLEYKTDVRRCRFDTLGKLTSAHRTGAPTARERWVCSRTVGESDCSLATVAGPVDLVHPSCGSSFKCSRTVCGPVKVLSGLYDSPTVQEHTHRSRAPALWAEVNFPTGINPARCSARTWPTQVHQRRKAWFNAYGNHSAHPWIKE